MNSSSPTMSCTLSYGYEMANNISVQVPASQSSRRTSRSSGSQWPCRVEKPKSGHNSPRTVERRKTTTGYKRYATLDDHYNMMFGITGEDDAMDSRPELARPVSWHPSSAHFHTSTSSSSLSSNNQAPTWNSAHSSDFYTPSARSSMYMEHTQNYNTSPDSHHDSSTHVTEPMPWYLQEWARKNEMALMGSRETLPTQHHWKEEEEMVHSGKELVGMGLYDGPDTDQSWSVESTGKGLKLEETWQPPDDVEEDDDDDDASSDDDGSVEELPTDANAVLEVKVDVPTKPRNSLQGQSFFFDEDETYTKEWWFHQLKQPVRDAGLGYGWL